MEYIPEKWVVVKVTEPDSPAAYKLFGSWRDAGAWDWRLSSGITRATFVDNHYEVQHYVFESNSGFTYLCATALYGKDALNHIIGIASKNNVTIEILPEETNWEQINYE